MRVRKTARAVLESWWWMTRERIREGEKLEGGGNCKWRLKKVVEGSTRNGEEKEE